MLPLRRFIDENFGDMYDVAIRRVEEAAEAVQKIFPKDETPHDPLDEEVRHVIQDEYLQKNNAVDSSRWWNGAVKKAEGALGRLFNKEETSQDFAEDAAQPVPENSVLQEFPPDIVEEHLAAHGAGDAAGDSTSWLGNIKNKISDWFNDTFIKNNWYANMAFEEMSKEDIAKVYDSKPPVTNVGETEAAAEREATRGPLDSIKSCFGCLDDAADDGGSPTTNDGTLDNRTRSDGRGL